MDLFFKGLLIVLLFCPFNASAIDITALYSTRCNRILGIPLDADASNIYFLKLNGEITKIPRYKVNVLATYPVDKLPIGKIETNLMRPVDFFKVFTKYNNKIVPYIQGHPVQFYQDKISFISNNGNEVIIDRNDIWKIDIENTPRKKNLPNRRSYKDYHFLHPHGQGCEKPPIDQKQVIFIHPGEYTSNPIAIKRHMDHIPIQLDILRNYSEKQKFYAVPQIYKNLTSLGHWFSVGGRHGSSNHRKKNLTPTLSNEYSRGPFGYQHIFLTGSAPLNKLVHANVQSHFYYSFKAEYFKFSFFIDPNNILIPGEKYNWQQNDFNKTGSQHFESSMVHLGFDFNSFSLGYSLGNLHNGVYFSNHLKTESSKFNKYYLMYQNHLFNTEFIYGKTPDDGVGGDYQFWRYNLELDMWDDYSVSYSLVYYTYQYPHFAKTKGLTNALLGSYRWSHKYIFKTMLGLELFGIKGEKSHRSPYVGISINLIF